MSDINNLVQLVSTEPLKTYLQYVAAFAAIDLALKGKINQAITWAVTKIFHLLPNVWKKLKQESEQHFAILERPSPKQQKILAWGTSTLDVLFAAYMNIVALEFFAITTTSAFYKNISLFKTMVGLLLALAFIGIGHFYRAAARNTAHRNGINVYLWKNKVSD